MTPAHLIRYERLPARGRTGRVPRWAVVLAGLALGPMVLLLRGSQEELWDGRDHLLVVNRSGFTERYRRFRYKDLQALQTWETPDGRITAFLLAILALGFAMVAVLTFGEALTAGVTGGIAVLMAVLLAWHLRRGATCRTRICTAVQTVELRSLVRSRAIEKTLPILRQRIGEAQGPIERGEMLALRSRRAAPGEAEAATEMPPHFSRLNPLTAPADLRAHGSVAVLCLADPLHTVLSLLVESPWLDAVAVLILVATATACVMAIRNQRRGAWPPLLRVLPWLALAIIGVAMILLTALMIAAAIVLGINVAESLQWRDWPPTFVAVTVLTLLNLATGLLGIIELRRQRKRRPPADAGMGDPAAPAT
jgi:hypothetical protein